MHGGLNVSARWGGRCWKHLRDPRDTPATLFTCFAGTGRELRIVWEVHRGVGGRGVASERRPHTFRVMVRTPRKAPAPLTCMCERMTSCGYVIVLATILAAQLTPTRSVAGISATGTPRAAAARFLRDSYRGSWTATCAMPASEGARPE